MRHLNVSAWYELSVKSSSILLIKIHRESMDFLKEICKDAPVICNFSKTLGLFIFPNELKSWGYGEILVPCESDDSDWLIYECKLPMLKNDGKSTKGEVDVIALRATLSVLFAALYLFEKDTKCKRPQLMIVDGFLTETGMDCGGFNVILTPCVSKWLSKLPDDFSFLEVEEAMLSTHAHMWRDKKFGRSRHDYRVLRPRSKWISLSVPGDRCDLNPDSYSDYSFESGYGLCPHNIDTSVQQLTLLVGLAKLQDLIRRNLNLEQ